MNKKLLLRSRRWLVDAGLDSSDVRAMKPRHVRRRMDEVFLPDGFAGFRRYTRHRSIELFTDFAPPVSANESDRSHRAVSVPARSGAS